ncbi:MAG TPA: molybdate ABC transporter substrate-binding protein [Thermoanaerobaculia bacterium]|nr:molybdate ABC transporter substrate-binding protein [Thermoanaerobaculia bacterium]
MPGPLLPRLLASLLPALALSLPAAAAEIRVLAAASLTDVLEELAESYQKASGDTLVLSFGASNLLARQVEEGAPADLFLSADEASMDRLEAQKLLVAGSRRSLLSNRLVIVVPTDSPLSIRTAEDLAGSAVRHLALAEPRTVPAGIYAREYLSRKGLWERLAERVIPADNVRAALAVVEGGDAEAGIVYASDARMTRRVRVAFTVPAAEGPRISYPVALLSGSHEPEAARRVLEYLSSEAALAVFRRYGFETPAP